MSRQTFVRGRARRDSVSPTKAHDPRVAVARAVGNRAFGRLLARRALTGAELSAPLVSWRLSGYDDLTKAYHNEKYLMVG